MNEGTEIIFNIAPFWTEWKGVRAPLFGSCTIRYPMIVLRVQA